MWPWGAAEQAAEARPHGQGVDLRAEHRQQRGRSVSAASIAIRTALIPPKPMERRNTCGKISSPASEMATVIPETATVRPAVAIVRARAVSTSACRAISSRNRLTMNNP